MAKSSATSFDRFRIKLWPREKALEELRKRTPNGDREWAILLLARTHYETIRAFLDPSSWAGESLDHLKNIAAVLEHVLNQIPGERLPANADRGHVLASFRQAVLHASPKVKL